MTALADVASRTVRSGVEAYLALLWLNPPGGEEAVGRFISAAAHSQGDDEEVRRWLGEGWREQLPAVVWLLAKPDAPSPEMVADLWKAFEERQSWVSPQIIVTLYLLDPAFPQNALSRLSASGPTERLGPEPPTVGPLQGTAAFRDLRDADPKAISALLAVVSQIPECVSTATMAASTPDLAALLENDRDQGDKIALMWQERIIECFRAHGVRLAPHFKDQGRRSG